MPEVICAHIDSLHHDYDYDYDYDYAVDDHLFFDDRTYNCDYDYDRLLLTARS